MGRCLRIVLLSAAVAISLYGFDGKGKLEKAKRLLGASKNDEAISLLYKIVKNNVADDIKVNARLLLAKNEKDYFSSLKQWQIVYSSSKDDEQKAEAAYTLASLYILHENYFTAEHYLEELLRLYSGSVYYDKGQLKLASVYLIKERYEDALNLYKGIERRMEDTAGNGSDLYFEALYGCGNALFGLENYASAVEYYDNLILAKPNFEENVYVIYKKALCYMYAWNVKRAKKLLLEIVRRYPGSYSAALAVETLKGERFSESYDSEKASFQIGSFSGIENAEKQRSLARKLGYDSIIVEKQVGLRTAYRVLVKVANDPSAIEVMKKSLDENGLKYFRVSK